MDALTSFVTDFLAEKLDIPTAELAADQPLEELGIDSLVLVELAVILEDKFRVAVDDDQLTGEQTLTDVVELLSGEGVTV
jgi:acyl carrier protein